MKGSTFVNARFMDEERTTIESRWKDADGVTRTEYCQTADNDVLFKNLLEHTTLDDIHEYTINWQRAYRKNYENFVVELAKKEGLIYTGQINPSFFEDIINCFFTKFKEGSENAPSQEQLFLFKLKLFEVEEIKNSKSRALKSKLRKSKDFLETFALAAQIYNGSK